MASKLNILRLIYRKPILQPLPTCQQHSSKRFLNESLKRKYEQFQIDDGVPVFLKAGASDRILFLSTVGLCIIGVLESARVIFTLAIPKKK